VRRLSSSSGITTLHKITLTTTGNNTSVQRQCAMKPTFFSSNGETHISTTYYINTTPLSYITPHSPMASLHVISDLTTWAFCWNLLLLVCFTIATILPSHSKKKRTKQSIHNNNHGQQTEQKHPYIPITPLPDHQKSAFTAACHLLSLLMSLILMATLFNSQNVH
jgi:hypothetical protein